MLGANEASALAHNLNHATTHIELSLQYEAQNLCSWTRKGSRFLRPNAMQYAQYVAIRILGAFAQRHTRSVPGDNILDPSLCHIKIGEKLPPSLHGPVFRDNRKEMNNDDAR